MRRSAALTTNNKERLVMALYRAYFYDASCGVTMNTSGLPFRRAPQDHVLDIGCGAGNPREKLPAPPRKEACSA
jgi:2-polyprenyl-3-methyl-5-hydroxy-6-metoxy-1,4-benzoquinol methylase